MKKGKTKREAFEIARKERLTMLQSIEVEKHIAQIQIEQVYGHRLPTFPEQLENLEEEYVLAYHAAKQEVMMRRTLALKTVLDGKLESLQGRTVPMSEKLKKEDVEDFQARVGNGRDFFFSCCFLGVVRVFI